MSSDDRLSNVTNWLSQRSTRRLVVAVCCLVAVVAATGGVASQSIGAQTTGDITITVNDSSNGEDSATTTVSIESENTTTGLTRFDGNGDGTIDRDEAVQTVIAYNTGQSIGA